MGSRRTSAILLLAVLSGPSTIASDAPRLDREHPKPRRLQDLQKRLGLEIVVLDRAITDQRSGFDISASPVLPEDSASYQDLLTAELGRYPASLFAKVGLKKIMVVSNLRVLGQPRAAVPDREKGWFWLDAEVARRIPKYGRHVLHHDFFHMVDASLPEPKQIEKEWSSLNPVTFRYGKGGWFMQSGNVGALREDLAGFLDEYATSAIEEDRAEVFGHLLMSSSFVRRRIGVDGILAEKVRLIKAQVSNFCPEIDLAWWKRNSW